MKNFINFITRTLINVILIIIVLFVFALIFIFMMSRISNTQIQDTISYIKSFGEEIITSSNNKDYIDISTDDTQTNSKNNQFYYSQLDDESKFIYNELKNNVDNFKKDNYTINFSSKFNTLLNQPNGQYKLNKIFQSALDAFFYDHPELFYIDLTKMSLSIKYITIGSKTNYTVSLVPQNGNNYLYDYFSTEEQVDKAISKVESIKNNIILSIPKGSDYSKVLEVHDILVNSIKYGYSSDINNSHNIYGALVDNTVVCEGYAKTFKYILDSLNIECILVNGNATNSSNKTESHMWNYIKLDNKWYGVDVTWDDPIIIGSPSKNVIKHDYFCKGSNVFKESHSIENKISEHGKSFSIPTLSYENYR